MENFILFLQIGFRHILEGYDHLLFLIGLIIVTRDLKTLLSIATAFTITHSTTLILSALDILSINPTITETFIAVSIAYVGIENLIVKDHKYRWIVAGTFGFVHGAGFSGHLTGLLKSVMGLGNVIAPLSGFNIGIELGQVLVIILIFPVFALLRKNEKQKLAVPAASVLIATAGIFLIISRLAGYEF